jgi:SPP1 gp7 family putative phage head morphogenesis protein
MPDGEIFDAIERFRRELLRNERRAASELVRVYGEAWKRIKAELEHLHTEYEAMKERGEKPGPDWIYQYNRARAFRDQVERELLAFSQYAEGKVREQQLEAIEAAERHAEELTRRALGKPPAGMVVDWNRIDRASVETILGMTQADSPLHKLLLSISGEGAQAAEDALVQGMLIGKNPREVAREMRKALGTQLSRALTIARTETLRAHREATRASYQANSDIVKGWVWHSAADERSCSACWAMHGTEHKLDEILDDHPNGRCEMVPEVVTWSEIGKRYGIDLSNIPDTNPEIEPGITLFEKLPTQKQLAILGPAKYAAWKDGKFTLSDLVGRKRSREWGTHRYEKSLAELGIDARSYFVVPKRSVFGKNVEQLVELARDLDARLGDILGDIGGKQRWSGKIRIKSISTLPDAVGVKDWNCDIWLRDDASPGTLVHELLHGRSPGLDPRSYEINKGLEEGVVEKLTRLYGHSVLQGAGLNLGERTGYDHYITALDEIRKRVNKGEEEFYRLLYSVALSERRDILIGLANDQLWVYDIMYYRLDVR